MVVLLNRIEMRFLSATILGISINELAHRDTISSWKRYLVLCGNFREAVPKDGETASFWSD